ncbi:MAG: SH3 domain-containing protein [Ruminococcus sp.]|nr:SH3 domain-containing protein [Ruminococcus sp.]
MSQNKRKRKTPLVARISPGGAVAIIVMGVFVMCLVVLVSKALFVSNSKDVPEGIDTATIGTNTQPVEASSNESTPAQTSASASAKPADASASQSQSVSQSQTQSTTEKAVVKMKVLDVTYLKEQPDEKSQDVIILSPNIVVDVLETLDSGWTKITFLNVTGQLTGYIQTSYLY